MNISNIDANTERLLQGFCERWSVLRIELFGSVARGDARPDSDVDLLVTFHDDAKLGLIDLVRMEWEISELLGQKVDLVERAAVEQSRNPIRKSEILSSAKLLYAA